MEYSHQNLVICVCRRDICTVLELEGGRENGLDLSLKRFRNVEYYGTLMASVSRCTGINGHDMWVAAPKNPL